MALTQVQGGMIVPSTTLTTPIVATTMGVGGATPAASGAGITFPATQSASSDANTLDDYEEGTWTPTVSFDGGTTGITYSGQAGNYTKIGNTVIAHFDIAVSNKGSSSGQLKVASLPFTSSGDQGQRSGGHFVYVSNITISAGQPYIYLGNGNTSGSVFTGANTTITNTSCSTSFQIIGYFIYAA